MDALALLCNLHADGPFTLQRLRRAGCDSLGSLLDLDPHDLSEHLEATDKTAERFQREAHLLAERLEEDVEWGPTNVIEVVEMEVVEMEVAEEDPSMSGEEPVEDEEAIEEEEDAYVAYEEYLNEDEDEGEVEDELESELHVVDLEAPVEEDVEEEVDEDELEEELEGELEEDLEDEDEEELEAELEEEELEEEGELVDEVEEVPPVKVGEVLDRWRELDREEPPAEPVPYVLPRPAFDPAVNPPLDELRIEGLAPELIRRLADLGVLTLKGLIDASALDLAHDLPLGYTRVKHVKFLAKREWEERSRLQETAAAGPPPADLEASGPFASDPAFLPD